MLKKDERMMIVIYEMVKDTSEKELERRENLIYTTHKAGRDELKPSFNSLYVLKEKQRKRLLKFLNRYKGNELLLVKCKDSFNIEDLFFKKDNYYLLTFVGILATYEEVPFIIHDLVVVEDTNSEYTIKYKHDSFRIKTKQLFNKFEILTSLGLHECREDELFEYVYFNYDLIFENKDLRKNFSFQKSIYEPPTCGNANKKLIRVVQ